jgi:hypothetical protein
VQRLRSDEAARSLVGDSSAKLGMRAAWRACSARSGRSPEGCVVTLSYAEPGGSLIAAAEMKRAIELFDRWEAVDDERVTERCEAYAALWVGLQLAPGPRAACRDSGLSRSRDVRKPPRLPARRRGHAPRSRGSLMHREAPRLQLYRPGRRELVLPGDVWDRWIKRLTDAFIVLALLGSGGLFAWVISRIGN